MRVQDIYAIKIKRYETDSIMLIVLILLLEAIFLLALYSRTNKKRKIPNYKIDVSEYERKIPSYNDLLNTDDWRNKRDEILKRDNHTCQYCHKTKNLQVHHKYYLQYPNGNKVNPWEYPDNALITLCDDCHKWIHSKKIIKTYFTKYKKKR